MTRVADNMHVASDITTAGALGDRRALLVVLTDKGRRAAERANAELRSYYDELLVDLSARERSELTSLLRKVLDRLEVATGLTRSAWPPVPT